MDGESASTPIRSRYAQQVSADLEKNRAAQQELDEQIADLQQRLEQLRADEKWLSGIRESLPATEQQDTASDSAAVEGSAEEAAVPQPRKEQPQSPAPARKRSAQPRGKGGKKAAPAKPVAKAPAKAAEKKPAAKKTAAKKTAAKKTAAAKTAPKAAGEPVLGDLLKDILDRHAGQPRTAGEVRDELEERHPERARDVNVVRNTLERLVAKSVIERARQKRTVLYTSAGNAESAAQAPAVEADEAGADKAAASA
ncbi:hypothetical protein [Streptomyces sp. NPDC001843]|uniref:hypothetical protein n=1 Tax=Streptomyces sp. NPDC001843 TaxID=3364617 RepID=UPI0036CE56F2